MAKGKGEAGFMDTIVDYANSRGWIAMHVRPATVKPGLIVTNYAYQGKGWPDLSLTRRERFVVAELKGKNIRALREDQKVWIEALRLSLPEVYVWNPSDWPEIQEVLK